jgi:hypothetical protein
MSFIGLTDFVEDYICEDCHEVYDKYMVACPRCDGWVVKADRCSVKGCKNHMEASGLCCVDCRKEAVAALSDALAGLDVMQVKYLDSLLDGETLLNFWRNN